MQMKKNLNYLNSYDIHYFFIKTLTSIFPSLPFQLLHVLQQHPAEAREASGRGRRSVVAKTRLHGATAALQLLRARVQGFNKTLQFQLLPQFIRTQKHGWFLRILEAIF